jgi:lysozyme
MAKPPVPDVADPALIIDVSHQQANAELAAARDAGVFAVMIKATEGATYQDAAFRTLYDKARAAGLRIGAYHFGTARPPAEQVENFVETVRRIAGGFDDLVPALDLEHNDNTPDNTISPDQGEEWVRLFRLATGRTPMLYAGSYLRDRQGAAGRPNLQQCPLWLADYETEPHPIGQCLPWTMWQFTDGSLGPYPGKVPGVGRCDQSVFRGDAAAAAAFWRDLAPAAAPGAASPAAPAAAAGSPPNVDVAAPRGQRAASFLSLVGAAVDRLDAGSPAPVRANVKRFLLHVGWHEGMELTRREQLGDGPARSFFQLEAHRAKDAMEYAISSGHLGTLAGIAGKSEAELAQATAALPAFGGPNAPWFPPGNLIGSLLVQIDYFAACLTRIAFKKVPAAIPGDNDGHARYWFTYWKVTDADPDGQRLRFRSAADAVDMLV